MTKEKYEQKSVTINLKCKDEKLFIGNKKLNTLSFNIKVMKILTLWPENNDISHKFLAKHALFITSFVPTVYALIYGLILLLNSMDDINAILDIVIALVAITAMEYMSQCLIKNLKKIQELVDGIDCFIRYGAENVIFDTENRIKKYTKGILLYGLIGNLCYGLFKLSNIQQCNENRTSEISKKHDPCGLIVHNWVPVDISDFPGFHIMFGMQLYVCITTSIIVLTITMLLVGLLMYVVALLQHCRNEIKNCFKPNLSEEALIFNMRFCIDYHAAILRYSANIRKAFSSMMLMHISLTSLEISILGFETLMVTSVTDSLRFGMHLFGWLLLLFLICSYGQKMIDESTGIGLDAYTTTWYNAPVCVQKDLKMMIMRSQRPLTLSAASLGVMSLETYLGVMTTAYSYFTLLMNIRNKA